MGALVQERARTDSRIRYRKLDSNEGIAGNTNQGFALATGEYIALLDHDDILHPCALCMWRKPSPSRARTLCTPTK